MKDPIVEMVRKELLERSQIGITKYGTTLARTDLDLLAWLEHLKQEQMDAVLYTQAAIESIRNRKEQ